jgi:regulatory protein
MPRTRPRRTDPAFPAVDADLRARALRLLARREHSRAELRRKLGPHVEEGVDLEALLDDFTRRGWLSEERVAAALAQARAGEAEALEAAWRSRFGRPPEDATDKARQVRFLQGRGFALESIMKLLRSLADRR